MVMKALASMPDVVESVHFYDPACTDASGFQDAVRRDFGSVNARVCETENGLLKKYDFVMYFGAFEAGNFGLLDVYKGRTSIAFVHVRTPGFGMVGMDQILPARKMFMERHLDFPPETGTMQPHRTLIDLAHEMGDRTFAFVELYRAERDFEREKYRFDRAPTDDDRAFRSHLGSEMYDAHANQDGGFERDEEALKRAHPVGGAGRLSLWPAAALGALTLLMAACQ
jgi:hypothetical protein